MSDRYFSEIKDDPMNGTPCLLSELQYRLDDHHGRYAGLSDLQFEPNYASNHPTADEKGLKDTPTGVMANR